MGRLKPYLAALAAAALLIATFLATLQPPPRTQGVPPEELPRMFVEAAQGLNASTARLNASMLGGGGGDEAFAEEMRRLADRLAEAAEEGVGQGALAEKLTVAAEAYSRLADAAADAEELASSLAEISPHASKMLKLAAACNIAGARGEAEKLRDALPRARRQARTLLDELAGVNESALLSDGHRRIYRGAYGAALKAYLMLGELDKVARLLLSNDPAALRNACVAARCGCGSAGLPGGLAQQLSQLRPGDAGVYGYEEAQVKAWLRASSGGSAGQGGSGAGEGGPSGED